MKFSGAIIKEQGVTFGIILVQPHVLNNSAERDQMQKFGIQAFGSMPIILASQTHQGFKTYGRNDIVRFLEDVHPSQIPWMDYTI
jgi:hypothetical protein